MMPYLLSLRSSLTKPGSRHKGLKFFFIAFLGIFIQAHLSLAKAAEPVQWQNLSRGLSYTLIKLDPLRPWARLHAFRFSLKDYQLKLAFAADVKKKGAYLETLARDHHALLAVNGGFFDTNYRSLGLRVTQFKHRYSPKAVSWWSVFYIAKDKQKGEYAAIESSYKSMPVNPEFAVQSGPRLVIHNGIPSLKSGLAERTAIGIDRNQAIILAVTEHAPMSTAELAQRLRSSYQEGGLNCYQALNLDGGSSSQFYTPFLPQSFKSYYSKKIAEAILIVPK